MRPSIDQRLGDAERQQRGGARQRNGLRPRNVALGMTCTARAGNLEMRGARVGDEIDDGAALAASATASASRRKQMAAGAAGREQHEAASIAQRFIEADAARAASRSPARRRSGRSLAIRRVSMAARGCSRVSASSMPMA